MNFFVQFSNPFTELFKNLLIQLAGIVDGLVALPPSVSAFAVAIILIGIGIKLATWPLNRNQMRSMRSMQKLQPKLEKLKEKHGDDREKLAQAQMELYREHGVNPFGGCLPMLIQLPILFGLYRAIYNMGPQGGGSGQLVGERFLWIRDLGLCEPSPLCTDAPGGPFGLPIPILLITMTLAQMAYQKYMTPPSTSGGAQAEAMQSVFKFMPLMFAFIFASLPSGLVLYYTVFTGTNIILQPLMRLDEDEPGDAESAEGEDGQSTASEQENSNHERSGNRRRRKKRKRK